MNKYIFSNIINKDYLLITRLINAVSVCVCVCIYILTETDKQM